MTFKVANVTVASAVANAGTFVVSYPAGTSAGDYATYGHSISATGLQASYSVDDAGISVSFDASEITVTYNGSTSIPADSLIRCQFNMRGEDAKAPYDRSGGTMLRMAEAKLYRIDLGSPSTADANGAVASQSATAASGLATGINGALASGGVATFVTPRNVVAAWTTTAVLTVTGTDEYGDTIAESSASGTTLTGAKAFKTVTAVTTTIDITSLTVGEGVVLGLPVFIERGEQVMAEYEDNVMLKRYPALLALAWQMEQVALLAGTPLSLPYPHKAGSIAKLSTMSGVDITTGGAVTMKVNNTSVDGLSVTVADAGGAGDQDSDTPTAGHASIAVVLDDELEIIPASEFATAGTLNGYIEITSTALQQLNGTAVMGVLTVPTATTGDVRGTYNPTTTPDGSTAFSLLVSLPDPTYVGVDNFNG